MTDDTSTTNTVARPGVRRLVVLGGLVLLVAAMVLDTRFLSPGEAAALNPAAFNAKTYVATNFPKIAGTLGSKGVDIAQVAAAVDQDQAAAGKKFGVDVGSGKFAFPVKAAGTVADVDPNFIELMVAGVPEGDTIRIPLGAAISGTPIRDATGDMTFSDFAGQTDFQSVANELKNKVRADVISKIDTGSLKGKKIAVVGAYSTGGPANSFIVQPVSIEVAP